MFDFLAENLIFAQGTTPTGQGQAGGQGSMFQLILPLILILPLFYFMLIRPNQKRERERKALLAAIKKNDHVVTSGGIKGVVTIVKAEENEVILRVDDDTGAKLRVVLDSIARVVAAEQDAASAKKAS